MISVRRVWAGCIAAAMCAGPLMAQYPGEIANTKPGAPELRAVAVLEWTGDLAHPKAIRLAPISVWDGQHLEDAGIYLARPQPLALDNETEYEIQKDGRNIGFFDVSGASETQSAWYGQGSFKPLPKAPSARQLAAAAARQKVDMGDADSDTPVLHRKHHSTSGNSANNGSSAGSTSAQAPAPDPDRPTLHSRADANDGDNNPSAPAPDPDRPRLSASEDSPKTASSSDKGAAIPGNDEAYVSSLPNAADPDRPRLAYGAPAEYGPAVKPTLAGLPADMKQAVAISDTRPIKEHPWNFTWSNPADEARMKADLEEIARKALAQDSTPSPSSTQSRKSSQGADRAATRPASSRRHRKTAPPLPALIGEQYRVFELQYGGGATMVLSARTSGTGEQEKFITLIAQPDLYGNVAVLTKDVTDAAHLDIKPQMKLIDAVDALNDNRGELLFELRGQTGRQFALYRVLRGHATKIFTTSPNYWPAAAQ